MVGGLADSPLGPTSLRLPGGPPSERLLLSARDLGRLWDPAGAPTYHPPPTPEDSSPRIYLRVSWSLPLFATWGDHRSISRELLALTFVPPPPQASSHSAFREGFLKHISVVA